MADKPLSPLEQKLANLKAKLAKNEAADVMQFDVGNGNRAQAQARKDESIARTRAFIAEIEAAIKAENKPVSK